MKCILYLLFKKFSLRLSLITFFLLLLQHTSFWERAEIWSLLIVLYVDIMSKLNDDHDQWIMIMMFVVPKSRSKQQWEHFLLLFAFSPLVSLSSVIDDLFQTEFYGSISFAVDIKDLTESLFFYEKIESLLALDSELNETIAWLLVE